MVIPVFEDRSACGSRLRSVGLDRVIANECTEEGAKVQHSSNSKAVFTKSILILGMAPEVMVVEMFCVLSVRFRH